METIEGKLKAVKGRFQEGSKQYEAARYIVLQNRVITSDERKAIIQEIPIADKTLQGVFTELRKMGLYPPQKTSDTSNRPSTPESSEETSHQIPEAPQISLQEYATKEEFETLKNSINYLAAVISGEAPSNPGEDEEDENVEVLHSGEMVMGEMVIEDPSLTRQSVWLKPKTQMYFDMSKEGVFGNYAGTKEPGPFISFSGNLSDFFNIIVDDYFIRLYYADIGLTMRRYVR